MALRLCYCFAAPQTAIMAVADLYLTFGAALLPHTDVGGQLKPLSSLLAQVRMRGQLQRRQGRQLMLPA